MSVSALSCSYKICHQTIPQAQFLRTSRKQEMAEEFMKFMVTVELTNETDKTITLKEHWLNKGKYLKPSRTTTVAHGATVTVLEVCGKLHNSCKCMLDNAYFS